MPLDGQSVVIEQRVLMLTALLAPHRLKLGELLCLARAVGVLVGVAHGFLLLGALSSVWTSCGPNVPIAALGGAPEGDGKPAANRVCKRDSSSCVVSRRRRWR